MTLSTRARIDRAGCRHPRASSGLLPRSRSISAIDTSSLENYEFGRWSATCSPPIFSGNRTTSSCISHSQARWWQIGYWYSGEFDCEYPINAYKKLPLSTFPGGILTNGDWATAEGASSFHPGGANFAFSDGSVKFIKDTISSWGPYNTSTGDPVGFQYGATCGENYIGTAQPLVYQQLATRNGGEVVSADSY